MWIGAVLSGVGAWDLSRKELRAPRRAGCKTHAYNQMPLSRLWYVHICMYVWRGSAGGPDYVAICNYYERYMYVAVWAGYVVINRYVVSGAPASMNILCFCALHITLATRKGTEQICMYIHTYR